MAPPGFCLRDLEGFLQRALELGLPAASAVLAEVYDDGSLRRIVVRPPGADDAESG